MNGIPSDFDVENKLLLIIADTEPHKLGKALARIKNQRTREGSTGETHTLATIVKPRGNDPGRGGEARGAREGRGGNGRGKREGRGHHHRQQQ